MSNKRDFKKYVDAVAVSMINNMMVAYYNVDGADRDAIADAARCIVCAAETAKSNANIYFDRGASAFDDLKAYSSEKRKFFRALFAKIDDDFAAAIQEALKKYNAAFPESVKEENKKHAEEA